MMFRIMLKCYYRGWGNGRSSVALGVPDVFRRETSPVILDLVSKIMKYSLLLKLSNRQ